MGSIPTTEVKMKVNPKVSYGIISISGLILALAQYLLAVGNALSAGEINGGSIGLIASATATFLGVAAGRYKQASDVIKGIGAERAANPMSVLTPDERVELSPEANVLYLDGKELAAAIVKSLNTNALINAMNTGGPLPKSTPAETTALPDANKES